MAATSSGVNGPVEWMTSFPQAQPHNGDRASKISSQKPKRIGENPKIFSQFFHENENRGLVY
jgi:hypothetical protein